MYRQLWLLSTDSKKKIECAKVHPFTMYQVKVFVLLLTLLCAVNGVKSLDFCFDASLEGEKINQILI